MYCKQIRKNVICYTCCRKSAFRQGEPLSPYLFYPYMNEVFLEERTGSLIWTLSHW